MRITRSHTYIKESSKHRWDEKKLARVVEIAEALRRSELVSFWLEEAAKESERSFDAWFHALQNFSKQDIIDIINEIGPEAGERFIKRFG